MAPLATEPRQLLVVLNAARRRALYTLVVEITQRMRSQLELPARGERPQVWGEQQAPGPTTVGSGSGTDSAMPEQDRGSGQNAGSDTAPFRNNQESKRPQHEHLGPGLIRLRRAAIAHFDEWRRSVLKPLREIVSTADDPEALSARKERRERQKDVSHSPVGDSDAAIDNDNLSSFQALYHPIPTRLTTIPREDREESISCVLVMMLAGGAYNAHSRTLAVYLTSSLDLPPSVLVREETEIARSLVEISSSPEAAKRQQQQVMSAEAEAQKRREEGESSRFWKVGLASVAGAAVIGITGGLAAPVVAGALGGLMGSVGLGGVASFLGVFWMNGALVGTLFGAYGAKMTGEMMDRYAREVEDFSFIPLKGGWGKEYSEEDKEAKDSRRLRVTIGINGWLTAKEEVTKPWCSLGDESEVFALQYEMESLLELGACLEGLVSSYAWSAIKFEVIRRTVLASLWAALWPVHLLRTAANIDNPFNRVRNRSEKAGKVLADALINKVQGERPVTLVGYSLGARVIYSCLRSLAERRAFGLVDQVVFIGAPVPSNEVHWQLMRSVVSGKMFNVYSENDYILRFLYRATSIQLGIAGLQGIGGSIPGVENLDLSDSVGGHLRYPGLIGKILARCGFPNVKDGAGDIEQDEDDKEAIAMREKGAEGENHSKEGSGLTQPDDLSLNEPGVQSAKKSQVDALSRQGQRPYNPTPSTVQRSNSDDITRDTDPLGLLGGTGMRDTQGKTLPASANIGSKQESREQKILEAHVPTSTVSKNAPQLPVASAIPVSAKQNSQERSVSPSSRQNRIPTHDGIDGVIPRSGAVSSAASLPSSTIQSSATGKDGSSDSGDESFFGIKMIDNDDDLMTYVEPVPLDE